MANGRGRGRGSGAIGNSALPKNSEQIAQRPAPNHECSNIPSKRFSPPGVEGESPVGDEEGGVSIDTNWQQVTNPRRRRDRAVFGRGTTSVAGLAGAPLRPRYVWLWRVLQGGEEDIKKHMLDQGVQAENISKVSHPDAKFSSFKIQVTAEHEKLVLNSEFWPHGLMCKKWWNRDTDSIENKEENTSQTV